MMSEKSPIEMMEIVAGGFGDLLERVVFVGGATTPLYYEDVAATRIRPTTDVDCVVEIASRGQYNIFEDELRRIKFKNDMKQGAPLCRWIYEDITVDVMPINEQILGFSNRWYPEGIRNATIASLPSGRGISILSLPYFVATKLEAFKNRGGGDFRMSHDIEDIVIVLDSLFDFNRMHSAPNSVTQYLQEEFKIIINDDQFIESVSGYIGYSQTSTGRAMRVVDFMKEYSLKK
ncbi:MAG: hypothetical protein A2W19_02870 [Spirochaetes bacterium RBG_16_49_21]|nr:MAG: hypothetical protein A2W19_02870 [Spirochaetes bacterium RBG_16_49_21]